MFQNVFVFQLDEVEIFFSDLGQMFQAGMFENKFNLELDIEGNSEILKNLSVPTLKDIENSLAQVCHNIIDNGPRKVKVKE